MTLIQIAALFLSLITVIGWLNARFLRLSPSVAMFGAGLVGALILLAAQVAIGPFWGFNDVRSVVRTLNFPETVLDYLLGFLLFASGLQADLGDLRRLRVVVWTLATVGVLLSTALVGAGVWAAGRAFGVPIPPAWALTFGALISPTDPIAVLGAVRSGAVSRRLGAALQGEALFNDGVGFVAYSAALAFATEGATPHPLHTADLIVLEAGGGLALGISCAWAIVLALRGLNDRFVAVTATMALAVGVYVSAGLLHLSGPIAAASAGLIVGDAGARSTSGEEVRRYVVSFWDLVDQLLNAVLFLLLGLQVFVLPFHFGQVGLWVTAVLLTAAARLLVVLPWGAHFRRHHEERGASLILTWGGLRGAVSLALALSLPQGPYRDVLLTMTFAVVSFSVVCQGLSFAPLAARLQRMGGKTT
jgi:monovalent cation:H+ antiporter, CPA1 family